MPLLRLGQEVHQRPLAHVSDDAAGLAQQVDFVQTHPGGGANVEGLDTLLGLAGPDVAHRRLGVSYVVGNGGEGPAQALLADPLHQTLGHPPVGVQGGRLIAATLATIRAQKALPVEPDADALAVDREIVDADFAGPVGA